MMLALLRNYFHHNGCALNELRNDELFAEGRKRPTCSRIRGVAGLQAQRQCDAKRRPVLARRGGMARVRASALDLTSNWHRVIDQA